MFDKKILLQHLNKAPLHEQTNQNLDTYSRAVYDRFDDHINNHWMDEHGDGSDIQSSGGRGYQGSAEEAENCGPAYEKLNDFIGELHSAGVEDMKPHIARKFGIPHDHRDWKGVGSSPKIDPSRNAFNFNAIQNALGFRTPRG